MIFFMLLLVLLCMMLGSNPEWIVPISLLFFIPIDLCIWIECEKNQYNPEPKPYTPSEKEAKRYTQTEEEFNEMAITTMYANYYLDKDN